MQAHGVVVARSVAAHDGPRHLRGLKRRVEEVDVGFVERLGVAVSSSTIRHELAELEALGLLRHPHTSAGRVPTEAGYQLYAGELVDTVEGRPAPFPLDLRQMRTELEDALQSTTDSLSQATRLLALVSAPSLDAATVRHVVEMTRISSLTWSVLTCAATRTLREWASSTIASTTSMSYEGATLLPRIGPSGAFGRQSLLQALDARQRGTEAERLERERA